MSITQRSGAMLHGRYRVLKPLGQGGMGAVYLAEDRRLPGRKVALKENQNTLPDAQSQFKREAVMLARLRHPNLPAVTDYFIDASGRQFLVMDYVSGENLKEHIRRQGAMPEVDALICMRDLLGALHYMHTWQDPETGRSTPIIHRDIKPANIKQTASGHYILVDFGIAKYAGGAGTVVSARALTPGYAPIEQYHGGTDQRSDIYALGATLFSLLSGHTPPSSTSMATGAPLPPLQAVNARASKPVEAALKKAMAVQPNDRFQTVNEMYRALFNESLTTGGGGRGATEPRTTALAAVGASVGATTARIGRDVRRRPLQSAILFLVALLILLSAWRILAGVQSAGDEVAGATLTVAAGQVIVATATPTLVAVVIAPTDSPSDTPSEESTQVAPSDFAVGSDGDGGQSGAEASEDDGIESNEIEVTPAEIDSATEVVDDDVQDPEPTAVIGVPTRPPTSTPLPTSTRLPTRTPTRPAPATATRTSTPTARPQSTATPTARPQSTATPTARVAQSGGSTQQSDIAAPVLVSPGEGQHHTHSRLTFQWRWTGTLQPNWGFEVRGWYPSGAHNGIHDARSTVGIQPDGNGIYSQNLKIPGQYSQGVWHWTVAVVQLEPYVRIGPEASPRQLSVDTATATPTPALGTGGSHDSGDSGDGR